MVFKDFLKDTSTYLKYGLSKNTFIYLLEVD